MNPHDYIISVNDKGEPYLEHALFGKGSVKDNHKWFARERVRDKWRYWYSPEEYRAWQQGRTRQARSEKKVSNTEKMRSAFKQLKETGRKAVDAAADKLGVDERKAAQEAWAQVPRHVNSSDKNAMKALKKATAADNEYFKTPLGKAESFKDRLEEDARGLASDVSDRVKSKSERMREELRKKASQAANDAKEKIKEKVDDIKETYEHNKHQFDKAKEMEKTEAEHQEKLANRPKAHEKPEATDTVKDGAMKRRSMEKSMYGEYKDGDHDFDDDNYKEENRVGDSDFFVHKRKDGTNVILEEDMKWVLPKGVDGKSPAIQKAIKDFSDRVVSERKLGNNYTGDQWRDAVTKAIDEAVRNTPVTTSQQQSNSGSGRSIDPHKASPEFMLEAGYNSGLDVSALKVADARHAKAQRAYNKAISNPNTSSQEKDRLFRELTKAEKAYYDEADKIADELNQK